MDTFNATKGATILIVDDSRFQRTIIRELLRNILIFLKLNLVKSVLV